MAAMRRQQGTCRICGRNTLVYKLMLGPTCLECNANPPSKWELREREIKESGYRSGGAEMADQMRGARSYADVNHAYTDDD